tara:strand:+ start:428 stop:700 length:273 start_codon:yes stop_codon:yes gene_type:complete
MKITNINIDELTFSVDGTSQDISYDLLLNIRDTNDSIVDIYGTDCEGTAQKWVFSSMPDRYLVVLCDNTIISDTENKRHDNIDPSCEFDF